MADSDAVLQANETFYAAFAAADMASMRDVWASDGPMAVVHPGTLPVTGHQEVLQSWREMLEPADAVDIVCVDPHVQRHGDMAVVLCQERLNGHLLAATNIYRKTADGWLLILHQAGVVAAAEPARSSVVH